MAMMAERLQTFDIKRLRVAMVYTHRTVAGHK